MVDDCIKRGKTVQEGGAIYNFTGPQGFGVANMADSLYAIKKLVYDQKKISITDYKKALLTNYGKGMDATSISEMTAQIAESLKEAGRSIGEKEVAAILSVVKGVSESREVRERGEKLLKKNEEIPK